MKSELGEVIELFAGLIAAATADAPDDYGISEKKNGVRFT